MTSLAYRIYSSLARLRLCKGLGRILEGPAAGRAFWLRDFKRSYTPPDPAKDILEGVSATRTQKSAAWHAFYDSRSWNELEDNLNKTGLPYQTEIALWYRWAPMARKYNSPPYQSPHAVHFGSEALPSFFGKLPRTKPVL